MLRPLVFLLLAISATPLFANDIDVAKRGVTRVIVATELPDGRSGESFGSGFAVASDKIVTNAHVVRLARQYPQNSIVVVVPSEGSKPFLARIEAFDASKDLAVLTAIDANLPALTIFAGDLKSGEDVATLGYPGNVDQATLRNLREYVTPQEPVLAEGNFSNIRSINNIEALIHNANIARGNSGGPLVDECGRVLGVNTFQTANNSGDSSFAFASSSRELVRFLRRANVSVKTIAEPCITAEEFAQIEQERTAEQERAKAEQDAKIAEQQKQAQEKAERNAERAISADREQMLFLAIGLLVGGALAIGGGLIVISQGNGKKALYIVLFLLGGLLIIGGVIAFLQRPDLTDRAIADRIEAQRFDSINDEIDREPLTLSKEGNQASADDDNLNGGPVQASRGRDIAGGLTCVIDRSRSRITTSQTDDIPFDWKPNGCVNGQTQYAPARSGKGWTRLLVPNNERTVSRLTFSPERSELVLEKYALNLAMMEDARDLRARISTKSCTASQGAIDRLSERQAAIEAILPSDTGEKLVYKCQ